MPHHTNPNENQPNQDPLSAPDVTTTSETGTSERGRATPPLAEMRPMAYRLFLAGVGLYALTREQLTERTNGWIARAEALEAERRARMEAKLRQHGRGQATPDQPLLPITPADIENHLPSRTEVQTINRRLDTLLRRLEELDNEP